MQQQLFGDIKDTVNMGRRRKDLAVTHSHIIEWYTKCKVL